MRDTEQAIEAIHNAATTKANSVVTGTVVTGTVAGGSVATANNPQVLGNYLATHFIGQLSYSEVIAIIGSTWVLIQILKTIIPFIITLVRTIMPKKPVKPSITTTSTDKVKKVKPPKATA